MTKVAKNLTRLLSRVGPNLMGATARDLKFLRRRGFRGFTPGQVNDLRARGMLPSVERELSGFNRGTYNMLEGAPRVETDNPPPFNGFSVVGGVTDPHVTIPTLYTPNATVPEREIRSAIARHEARELVRMRGSLLRGKYDPDAEYYSREQLGTSHYPGVMYDERIFRSGLSNRLGFGTPWNRLPLGIPSKGRPIYRGVRDSFIGSQPLKYEFGLRNRWNAMRRAQAESAKRSVLDSLRRNGASWGFDRDVDDVVSSIGGSTGAGMPTRELVKAFVSDTIMGRTATPAVMAVERLPLDAQLKIQSLVGRYSGVATTDASKLHGMTEHDFTNRIIDGGNRVDVAPGSDMAKIMRMGVMPGYMSPLAYVRAYPMRYSFQRRAPFFQTYKNWLRNNSEEVWNNVVTGAGTGVGTGVLGAGAYQIAKHLFGNDGDSQ